MDNKILKTIEFDLTEAIKDLISEIKVNREEINHIKQIMADKGLQQDH